MVIVTPYDDDAKAFYYNQKINCMNAEGYIRLAENYYEFKKGKAFGGLDWGRGVWTYKNTWYWSSASSQINGIPFGFNLGYGFGNTDAASENMVFYNGKAHKLEGVTFCIPHDSSGKDDYLSPWQFVSSDGRFEATFEPILNRHSHVNALVIESNQNQVFGKFTGYTVLDNGVRLEFSDLIGFAEKVYNRW